MTPGTRIRTRLSTAILLAAACARDPAGDAATRESIRVDHPAPDDTVGSPLVVKGEARGGWYFEATFPVRLLDEDGRELAAGAARATGGWMTEAFVPFEATLEFETPTPGMRGTLVLEKDNPSALPENAGEFRVPVTFGASPERTMTVRAWFSNPGLEADPGADCGRTFPVTRTVPWSPAPARAALEALLAGPTDEERARGYSSSIRDGVTVRDLIVRDGVAAVDFSEAMERTGGACLVTAIRAQVESTLTQFPAVRQVRISIEGRTGDILQP
jgi:hypothetical protein